MTLIVMWDNHPPNNNMTNSKVTLEDVFLVTNRIENKLDRVEVRVSALEIWRAQFIGQLTVVVSIINLAIAISFDWIKKQVFKNNI